MTPEIAQALAVVGQEVSFSTGDALRLKGAFAPDMLFLTSGRVDCILDDAADIRLSLGPGSIVGERGFLTGKAANATLRAVTDGTALSLDAAALGHLQQSDPTRAAEVLRFIARTMSDRDDQNEELLAELDPAETSFEIVRCSTLDLKRTAQRVRYDVYCLEFGRNSPYANTDEGTIIDPLDDTGTSFLAYHEGQAVGTVRVNFGAEGDLGPLPELYGIGASGFALDRSAVITKYAIRESHRGGSAYIRLFAAVGSFVHASGASAIFIDCVPKLARFYATMGFERSAEDFAHYENGLSVPMVLDLDAYQARMSFEERHRKNRWR